MLFFGLRNYQILKIFHQETDKDRLLGKGIASMQTTAQVQETEFFKKYIINI